MYITLFVICISSLFKCKQNFKPLSVFERHFRGSDFVFEIQFAKLCKYFNEQLKSFSSLKYRDIGTIQIWTNSTYETFFYSKLSFQFIWKTNKEKLIETRCCQKRVEYLLPIAPTRVVWWFSIKLNSELHDNIVSSKEN